MRRYPRESDSKPADHLALKDKDGKADYMISPDEVMSIQLVAFDDLIQYIVDGELVYEIAEGDKVQVETRAGDGTKQMREHAYDLERFPIYREGYFGFRMVGTHHIYYRFRVHELKQKEN